MIWWWCRTTWRSICFSFDGCSKDCRRLDSHSIWLSLPSPKLPPPETRRELIRFLGMSGYYRRFCTNYANVAAPLTTLTSTKRSFTWIAECLLHPVTYYFSKLKPYQLSYSTIEKEGLALILALKRFECYLLHHPEVVKVYSDHNPLVFIKCAKLHNQRVLRWALLIQSYNIEVHPIKGEDNIIADTLSRSLPS